jgi:hypothetical protein
MSPKSDSFFLLESNLDIASVRLSPSLFSLRRVSYMLVDIEMFLLT